MLRSGANLLLLLSEIDLDSMPGMVEIFPRRFADNYTPLEHNRIKWDLDALIVEPHANLSEQELRY